MKSENKYIDDTQKTKRRRALSGRNFKQGLYSSIITIVVIAIVIVINLFVSKLDIKIDLTEENVYTLTEETKDLANNLTEDIDIYYIVKEDDEYTVLKNVINQYGKYPHINVTWKDPELYPQFAAQYTDGEIQGNDVVVVNKSTGLYKFVPFDEMYNSDYTVNYTTGQYEQKYTLDAEGRITSAIQYVTSVIQAKMYIVSAHGERKLGDGVSALINKANIDMVDFDVKSATEIPDDCNMLLIDGPVSDISKEELDMYKNYLDNGGNAILAVAYTDKDMTNYNSLLEYYGVKVSPAVIVEADGYYMNNYPSYLMAGFETVESNIAAEFSSDDFIICPITSMLELSDASTLRTSLKTTALALTSEGSYAKVNPQPDSYLKEEGDPEGPFELVIQAEDTYKDKSSKVAIFATPYMFEDDWIDYYTCRNIDLLIDTVDWMNDVDQETVAIPERSLDAVYIDVPFGAATLWGVLTIIVIPLGILVAGIVVWLVRRKR